MRIAILPLVILTALALAGTINIPADYPTIQEGIDAASPGDTVLVQPGTYVENINYNGQNIVVGSLTLTTGDSAYISQTIIDGYTDKISYYPGEICTVYLHAGTSGPSTVYLEDITKKRWQQFRLIYVPK